MLAFSVIGIYMTYLVGKELFDKRIALASSFILTVSYLNIFYTARILIDILMMSLWLLAIFFFWKGYVKNGPRYYLWLMAIAIGLGASLKMPFVLIAAPLVVYVFLNEGFSMFKNKKLWLSVLFSSSQFFPISSTLISPMAVFLLSPPLPTVSVVLQIFTWQSCPLL